MPEPRIRRQREKSRLRCASPPGFDRDPELRRRPTSRPGAKLPHAWTTSGTRTLPTLDTVGRGRFTLIIGIGGETWVRAAGAQDLEIAAVVIGPGQQYEDPYGDWARLSQVPDGGALLIHPDGYVAFRHPGAAAEDAGHLLAEALRRILGHA